MAMLAQTPPMGFNTWNTFGPDVNEEKVLGIADTLVEKGFRDAGYRYLVVDDYWSLRDRNEQGELVANPERFPHGMKYVADYLHERGLKFGMYSCAGTRTCGGFPSSFDHEYQDARTFASWGVDFLKYDFCNFPAFANPKHRYLTMAQALRASGREILFSACNWGCDASWNWMRSIGAHMYRSTGDIRDEFSSTAYIMRAQMENFNANAAGCFNDMDMLTVGMDGQGYVGRESRQTYAEYETQFAFWCFTGAPLMLGADLRVMDDRYRPLLQNPRLIALNQDPECRPALLVCDADNLHMKYILLRYLADGSFAICVLNFSDGPQQTEVRFNELGVPAYSGNRLHLTDIITGEDIGLRRDDLFTVIPAHSCKLYRAVYVRDN